jgi:hypothetical protein
MPPGDPLHRLPRMIAGAVIRDDNPVAESEDIPNRSAYEYVLVSNQAYSDNPPANHESIAAAGWLAF